MRIVALLLAMPFVVFATLITLLYLPPVQHWAVDKAAQVATDATGMDIRVGRVRLAFPLDFALEKVVVRDSLQTDTLAALDKLRLGVAVWPLLRGQVQVGKLDLSGIQAHTGELIPSLELDGSIGRLHIQGVDADLTKETVDAESLLLQVADMTITLRPDTLSEDSISSPVGWKFFLGRGKILQADIRLQMPIDTVSIAAGWGSMETDQLTIDLETSAYGAARFCLRDGNIAYDGNDHLPLAGFDPKHIAVSEADIQIDSLFYNGTEALATIRQLAMKERSGLHLTQTGGKVQMDSLGIILSQLGVETTSSHIQATGKLPWSALQEGGNGKLDIRFQGDVGKSDVLTFMRGASIEAFTRAYPSAPLNLNVQVSGNLKELTLDTLNLYMDSVASVHVCGYAQYLTDDKRRKGEVTLSAKAEDLQFLSLLTDSTEGVTWAIPSGTNLKGTLNAEKSRYDLAITLQESEGEVSAIGYYDTRLKEYDLQAHIDSLALHHFLPRDSFLYLTAHAKAVGKGTDLYDGNTHLRANVSIEQFQYGRWDISDILLKASLKEHQAQLVTESHNPLLDMQSHIHAMIRKDSLRAEADIDIARADLLALQLTEKPLDASVRIDFNGATNWTDAHKAQGSITGMNLMTTQGKFTPKDLNFRALTRPDSTHAQVKAGDLNLQLDGANGIEKLAQHTGILIQEIQQQLNGRTFNLKSIKELLPEIRLTLISGKDNPIVNYLQYVNGISMNQADVDIAISPLLGIQSRAFIHRLRTDSLELDTVKMRIMTEDDIQQAALSTELTISNAPNRRKPAFTANLGGTVSDKESHVQLSFYNGQQQLGLNLGASAQLEGEDIRLSFFPEQPTIGFRTFALNKDNHITLNDSGRVEANVSLLDKAGTGLRLYSSPNTEALQDLTVDLKRLNLKEILDALPYIPEMAGMLDAELHYIEHAEENNFSGTLLIDDFVYEGYPLGNIGMEAVYLPTIANEHIVSLQLMQANEIIATADGTLATGISPQESDSLSANIQLEHFPIHMANAFLPRDIVTTAGKLNGELSVKGALSSPRINGIAHFDSVKVHSPLYAVDFRMDKTPVRITDNKLTFDNFQIYAQGKNPFTLTGEVNLGNFSHMTTNLQMRATDYELLNAKKNKNSILYGKAFISLFATIKGELDNPVVRGNMNILGNTDVTYILKESPLTVEDRLGGLVTFVNFNDTTTVPEVEKEVTLGGVDMLLNVQIDQGAQVQVDLGSDNYVEVQGGGNLSLQYTPQGDLLLTGRYTLNNGQMKYSLPVIPLKTFNIATGSYIEFSGDPANPYLNITATERVRTSVTEENNTRYANFDVGVNITNTLENMGLAFTLNAPEDVTLQNQLATMSAEERGKLAVTMLVTGMYVGGQGGGNTAGFSANNALNSFLQNEISNIAGNALKTVDVSIGVEDNYSADGTTLGGTDYSFRFAKRFWNNRLSVIIGGRISTGNEAIAEENNSFIDDISLEWRLDNSGTRYVKLFHTKNYESILEGEIIETGVGLVLRRKVNKLGELFIFRKRKTSLTPPKREIPTTSENL